MRSWTKGSPRLPFVVWTLLAASVLLGAGCADMGGEAMRQDLSQLRQDLNALTLALHRSRGDTEAVLGQLDRRTREQAADGSRQLAGVVSRVDALAAELTRAMATLEAIAQRVETLSRQLAARAPAGPATPAPPGPLAPAAPRAPAEGPGAEQAYQAAYLDFTKGNFPLALSGFREFVRRFPDSALADKAQYWIGEAHFSLARGSAARGQAERATQEFEHAVQEFRKVILNYPRGEKVPTAIYKEALALLELRQPKLARSRLQYLLDHFPQSEEAPLARERLAALSG